MGKELGGRIRACAPQLGARIQACALQLKGNICPQGKEIGELKGIRLPLGSAFLHTRLLPGKNESCCGMESRFDGRVGGKE